MKKTKRAKTKIVVPSKPVYARIIMRSGVKFDPVFHSQERFEQFLANIVANQGVAFMELEAGKTYFRPSMVDVVMKVQEPKEA